MGSETSDFFLVCFFYLVDKRVPVLLAVGGIELGRRRCGGWGMGGGESVGGSRPRRGAGGLGEAVDNLLYHAYIFLSLVRSGYSAFLVVMISPSSVFLLHNL